MTAAGDTIAAVATAPGRGGVAVVRVSGPDAFAVARAVAGGIPEPGRFKFANFRDGGAQVDSGLVAAFASPKSYTGEDVVEFHCHGGTVTPRRVMDAAVAAGARPARRGEFTLRAFLNGKIDISQAEAVKDLVDARTARAADAALACLAPGGGEAPARRLRGIYDRLLALSAVFEHALDVDEADLADSFRRETGEAAAALLDEIRAETRRLKERRMMRDGALVVIAGPPNAGKSSLMNALLDSDRAIVSPAPGTTRDAIDAWLDVRGWPVRLVDTAGIRDASEAAGPAEVSGIERSERLASGADVLLLLSPPESRGEEPVFRPPAAVRVIEVSSKCDLGRGPGLNVSSATGEGLDALEDAVASALEDAASSGGFGGCGASGPLDGALAALSAAAAALEAALPGRAPDPAVAANSAASAARIVGEACGAEYSDDMLDRLFSGFCVGK